MRSLQHLERARVEKTINIVHISLKIRDMAIISRYQACNKNDRSSRSAGIKEKASDTCLTLRPRCFEGGNETTSGSILLLGLVECATIAKTVKYQLCQLIVSQIAIDSLVTVRKTKSVRLGCLKWLAKTSAFDYTTITHCSEIKNTPSPKKSR